jgi:hypothetical protein
LNGTPDALVDDGKTGQTTDDEAFRCLSKDWWPRTVDALSAGHAAAAQRADDEPYAGEPAAGA